MQRQDAAPVDSSENPSGGLSGRQKRVRRQPDRTATRRGEEWRTKIVEQAARLFNEVGYHAATMDDLADAVGLAKPSLYYYFRAKEDILFEISRSMILKLISSIEARNAAGLTSSQLILEAMADVIEATQSDPGRMRVLVEHTRDLGEDQYREVMALREKYRVMLEELVTKAIDAGGMRPVDVPLAARAIFGMCNWAYHWIDGNQKPRDIAYVFWDIIYNGCAAQNLPRAATDVVS